MDKESVRTYLELTKCLLLQVISFLRKKDGFIGLVLKHIDASAMMDLLLRLISCVEPAPLRQEVLNVSCHCLPAIPVLINVVFNYKYNFLLTWTSCISLIHSLSYFFFPHLSG